MGSLTGAGESEISVVVSGAVVEHPVINTVAAVAKAKTLFKALPSLWALLVVAPRCASNGTATSMRGLEVVYSNLPL